MSCHAERESAPIAHPGSLRLIPVIGLPGSGKSTTARLLAAELSASFVSSSDLLRRELNSGGASLGSDDKQNVLRGLPVSDDAAVKVILAAVAMFEALTVIEGFPRTAGQAAAIDTHHSRHTVPFVLFLDAPRDVAVGRVSARSLQCVDCGLSKLFLTAVECEACGGSLRSRASTLREAHQRLTREGPGVRQVVQYYRSTSRVRRMDASMPVSRVVAACLQVVNAVSETKGKTRCLQIS